MKILSYIQHCQDKKSTPLKPLCQTMIALMMSMAWANNAYASQITLLAQEISQTIDAPQDTVPARDGLDEEAVLDALVDNDVLDNPPLDNRLPKDDRLSVLNNVPDPLAGIEGLHPTRVPLSAISPDTLKTFVAVVDLVRRQHIGDVNDEQLFKNAMSGMLSRLDDHAEFLDAEAFANLQSFTAGSIANVGVQVYFDEKSNHWVIDGVDKDSPADMADIARGDYLHQINETKLSGSKNQNDVEQLLNGIAGTQVELIVSREGRNKRTVYLQRSQIQTSELNVQMHQGVAVVKLPVFQENTRQQFVESLIRINTPIQGIIIDTRNNPGGVLESAMTMASLFIENKPLVQIKSRADTQTLTTFGAASLATMPVIILQNRYSASAAEVLAAGLQSNQRAIIMGETSYGKGSVQSVIPIDDGQAVKLTTAHYHRPNGDEIEAVGIVPDVELTGDESFWLIEALNYMQERKLQNGVLVSVSNDY